MTRTRPRGPKVEMPRRPPPGSSTGPPSSLGVTPMSRVMRRSIRPPARLCQDGPTEWMTPSLTEMPPSSAPRARASPPGCGSPAGSGAGSGVPSSRKATTLVPGSRPATRAVKALPSANVTCASPTSGNLCSEATTTSLRQSVPERIRCPGTAMPATRGRASLTRSASASDKLIRGFSAISAMIFSPIRRSQENGAGRDTAPPAGWGGRRCNALAGSADRN